jgi:hypothetical protein
MDKVERIKELEEENNILKKYLGNSNKSNPESIFNMYMCKFNI